MSYLLGIDSGLTVTKAVLFDLDGGIVGMGRARVRQDKPHPHWVERDTDELLRATAQAIREALGETDPKLVVGIGVTAHGDGLYLLDERCQPTRPAILSLDSRAQGVIDQWRADGSLSAIVDVTGQVPFASTPAAVLAWMTTSEPETIQRSRWALSCKDTIKAWLTGTVTTDPTEASVSFTDMHTQRYSDAAFGAYSLTWARDMVAPVVGSCEVAGTVSDDAARLTGLAPGTPVASGMHDVDACAVASGSLRPGQLSLVAGTYSINQVVSTSPRSSERWNVRNFIDPGTWMNMAVSPASATNLEWYVDNFVSPPSGRSQSGASPFSTLLRDVAALPLGDDDPLYLPFLYGSPAGPTLAASVLGLRGWHTNLHVARAVLEGVAFTHRWHVDDLADAFPISATSLTGGAAQSSYWSQLFADALGRTIDVADLPESGALGVALAAGVAVGRYQALTDAVAATTPPAIAFTPEPTAQARLDQRYQQFRRSAEATLALADPLAAAPG
ncbi:MAG: FGGY-family carbohydrate kinase [Beutenbergiaceae bacterium]